MSEKHDNNSRSCMDQGRKNLCLLGGFISAARMGGWDCLSVIGLVGLLVMMCACVC